MEPYLGPAGALRSSADDLLAFLGACLDPPPGPLGAALRLAARPQLRLGRRAEIGLCWIRVRRPRKPLVVWHNGGTWGFRSFAGFDPQRRTAAVVMSSTARGVEPLGFDLLEALSPDRPRP
jgi:CubicO group peptidase (beta-lactamase class C family)